MNHKILILILLNSWSIVNVSAQSYITLGGEKNMAIKNLYLTDGFGISAGYQYRLQSNFFIDSQLSFSILKQNKAYSFRDEPNLLNDYDYFLISQFTPTTLYGAAKGNLSFGYYFMYKYKVRPFFLLGVCTGYISHQYSNIAIEPGTQTTATTFELVQQQNNQLTIGLVSQIGLNVKITNRLNLKASINYNTLPYVKVGIQEINVKTYGWQIGISTQIRKNESEK